jgi:tetratricopeptide (TPR) repeat protein
MSLLIKALEQAAKDRTGGRTDAQSDAPEATTPMEPTLEPAPPPRAPRAHLEEASPTAAPSTSPEIPATATPPSAKPLNPKPHTASAPSTAPLALDQPSAKAQAAKAATARSVAGLAQIDAQQQRARAAAVMQATGGSAATAMAFLRANPVISIGGLALLLGLGYGVYVYLQIAHPGMFVRQASSKPTPAPQAPPASQPAAPSQGVSAPGGSTLTNSLPEAPTPTAAPKPVTDSVTAPPATTPARAAIPATAIIGGSQPTDAPRASAPERPTSSEPRRDRGSLRTENAQAAPAAAPANASPPASAPAPAAAEGSSAPRERIAVSATNAQPRLNPMLSQAYAKLQAGQMDEAEALYTKLRQAEPLNIDALLGLASIAVQQNRTDEATRLYLRILELNPRYALAQAALIGLMGRADPAESESRLKQLIAREPSPFLHFVLGNLYAEQSRWSQAQQAYFQAHHLEPSNPDYAYNLAVGLDHLRQSKLALNYYRRAEQLASAQGRSNFDVNHARERIRILSSGLE